MKALLLLFLCFAMAYTTQASEMNYEKMVSCHKGINDSNNDSSDNSEKQVIIFPEVKIGERRDSDGKVEGSDLMFYAYTAKKGRYKCVYLSSKKGDKRGVLSQVTAAPYHPLKLRMGREKNIKVLLYGSIIGPKNAKVSYVDNPESDYKKVKCTENTPSNGDDIAQADLKKFLTGKSETVKSERSKKRKTYDVGKFLGALESCRGLGIDDTINQLISEHQTQKTKLSPNTTQRIDKILNSDGYRKTDRSRSNGSTR